MDCVVLVNSKSSHLSQLYTGYSQLHRSGSIKLRQIYSIDDDAVLMRVKGRADASPCGLMVVLDGRKLLYYDCKDSDELDKSTIECVDAYFKRSYDPHTVPEMYRDKVYPLGLYYEVHTDGFDRFEMMRYWHDPSRKKIRTTALLLSKALRIPLKYIPTLSQMHEAPNLCAQPRVLFMVRAWDPDHDKEYDLTNKEREDRTCINEMRANCVELLRKSLGHRFYGGFAHTDYAVKKYPSLLLDNKALSDKKKYISLLRGFPICIATTGLHRSIGGKLGEYVAFSKAIVSEKLSYTVPGGFAITRNYLEFTTPEQCLNNVTLLFESKARRDQMMISNDNYYNSFLRPDRLVFRSLELANGSGPAGGGQ